MPTTPCSPPADTSASRSGYAAPLRLRISPSPWLRRVFIVLHLSAALAIVFSPLIVWLLLLPLLWQARVHWRGQPALSGGGELLWDAQGEWLVGGNSWHLDGESWVTPSLLILRLRGVGGVRSLLLPADATEAEPLRRLRVRLNLEAV